MKIQTNFAQADIDIYINTARKTLQKLTLYQSKYKVQKSELENMNEQLRTIALYLSFSSVEHLTEYLNQ